MKALMKDKFFNNLDAGTKNMLEVTMVNVPSYQFV